MIILAVTKFGWAFFASLALSLLITKGVLKRMSPGKNSGCITFGFTAAVVSIVMSMVLTLSISLSQSMYGLYSKPDYQATVISYTSKWEERTNRDSDGRSRKRSVLMHRPTVRFTDANGNFQELPTNISSGSKPVVGEKIHIVYYPGDQSVQEKSFRSFALLGAGVLMLFLMGFVLYAVLAYALGRDMSRIKSFGLGIIVKLLFPFGMSFLLAGMGYALYLYFTGQKEDMPGWAVGICIFFCLVLMLSLPAYLKMAFGKGNEEILGEESDDFEEEDFEEEDFEEEDEDEFSENSDEEIIIKPEPIRKNRSTPLD